MSKANARTAMPLVTAWVNDLRGAFGSELIDGLIAKATTEGLPTFYASENGYKVGVPLPAQRGVEISAADMVLGSNPEVMAKGRRP
jgi:hypothetical protein